jgi:hypothetical protein
MEITLPTFSFNTDDHIHGLVIELVDNNPYPNLEIDIWFDSLHTGTFNVPHYVDINDDCFGSDTSIFRTDFKPFKTTKIIKIKIKTELLYNDKITMQLLTKNLNKDFIRTNPLN